MTRHELILWADTLAAFFENERRGLPATFMHDLADGLAAAEEISADAHDYVVAELTRAQRHLLPCGTA